jgi:hypothetical protein
MLVIALLANQAATCVAAHSHDVSEPANHSARRHVHLFGHSHHHHDSGGHHHWSDHGHSGDHHHTDDHHHSSDHDHTDEKSATNDSQAGLNANLPCDHDSDAVYFGVQDSFEHQSKRLIGVELGSDGFAFVIEQPRLSKPAVQLIRTRAGPYSGYRCAIYQQTSRLLI